MLNIDNIKGIKTGHSAQGRTCMNKYQADNIIAVIFIVMRILIFSDVLLYHTVV